MNLSKYEHAERKEAEASKDAPETPQDSGAEQKHHTLFGKQFTEKEQKTLFLYLVIGIVLMELAVTVGAIIISITNAQPSSSGVPHFQFPWIGYLVAVVMVPVLAMLLVNLVSLGFSRGARGGEDVNLEGVPQRMQTFYALVRGAPTVILFAGFVLMCAAIYYLDVELYPLDMDVIESLNYGEMICAGRKDVFQTLHQAEWNVAVQVTDFFGLHKIQGDSNTCALPDRIDLVYFDAFAPDKQPEMWNQEIFNRLYARMTGGGVLTTYCAKGVVRRMMKEAGYSVERIPGPPGKREMLRAIKL